jgi:protein SEY1
MSSPTHLTANATNGSTTANGTGRRPTLSQSFSTPGKIMNGHFAAVGEAGSKERYEHGIQVINEEKEFNDQLPIYLQLEHIIPAGFNYHLISVFGSQSTGKSTLLNYLFGTQFGVMSEEDRRQTTKGIWMSKNKNKNSGTKDGMAENILVMDVEGTDGRERGEDQDFERKSALFALATSEVLIVNIWEHQVGLYQGANMGLLKTVFEVNLELFVKGSKNVPRSLLFFVIRDHIGNTPLQNLRKTLILDLERLWSGISKPKGLENSKIGDYFDFAFAALPHKILKPDDFEKEVKKLGTRFREGYKDPKTHGLLDEESQALFLPEYHRRVPADGLPMYAKNVWDQIVENKDLDLPTQQELLAQFRCDEIAREVLVAFDETIKPLETEQADHIRAGTSKIIKDLGNTMTTARSDVLKNFETEASRYHKGVYQRKRSELESNIDTRLKALFKGQLNAAHKSGIAQFSDSVAAAVKRGQKHGAHYDFAQIVEEEKSGAYTRFDETAKAATVEGAPWADYSQEFKLYRKELDEVSKKLRQEEMRRLATRVERWVKSRLDESIGLEFNSLGSGRAGSGAPEQGEKPASEKDIWDRIWEIFTNTVSEAEKRFTDRASSYDASPEEVEVGLWRLRRKSWAVLKQKIDEECSDANLGLKLRENFEDGFRYDDQGTPRIWRPTDDIEGAYNRARDHTVTLIPILSRFKLSRTSAPPPLDAWIGHAPPTVQPADEEDLVPIGGLDEEEGKSLEEEMIILSDSRRAEIEKRFRKTAEGVFVEAKRGALGGVTETPWWMWALLLVLGQNEIRAVASNPLLIVLVVLVLTALYVTYQLNLWGPIIRMTTAAYGQAREIAIEKLRDFLANTETGRQAVAMSSGAPSRSQTRRSTREDDEISLDTLNADGRKTARRKGTGAADDDDMDDDNN